MRVTAVPRGILGLRQGGWLGLEPERLISMATSSGHRGRQKIKRRGGGGKKGSFSPALGSPAQKCQWSSRVGARERPRVHRKVWH